MKCQEKTGKLESMRLVKVRGKGGGVNEPLNSLVGSIVVCWLKWHGKLNTMMDKAG